MSLEFCYKSLKSQGCCSKKKNRKEKLYQKTLYGKACVCPKSVSYQNINAVNINAVIRGTKKLNSEYLKAVCRCSVVQLGVWLAGLLLRCVSQWYMKDSKASVLPSFDVHSKRLINFSHIPPKLWWLALSTPEAQMAKKCQTFSLPTLDLLISILKACRCSLFPRHFLTDNPGRSPKKFMFIICWCDKG